MHYRHLIIFFLVLAPAFLSAADLEVNIVIKNHRFVPAEVKIPVGKKIKLIIDNQDSSVEEFESHELNREKVIPANSKMPIFIGPLKVGKYPYYGEFHKETAFGTIIVE